MKPDRLAVLRSVLTPLLDKPSLAEWMEVVAGNRERTLGEFGNYQTISDPRVTKTCTAEFSVYDDLVGIYEEKHPGFLESLEQPQTDNIPAADRIRASMFQLVGDTNFQALMSFFREEEKAATMAIRGSKTQEGLLSAIGRLNAFKALRDDYRAHVHAAQNQLVVVPEELVS